MTQLMNVQCTCGTVFQVGRGLTGWEDWDGNLVCDNCAVEKGLREGLAEEPPEYKPEPTPEGADVPAEEAPVAQEAPKVDLRTKEGRALKAALEAAKT